MRPLSGGLTVIAIMATAHLVCAASRDIVHHTKSITRNFGGGNSPGTCRQGLVVVAQLYGNGCDCHSICDKVRWLKRTDYLSP